MILEFGAHDKKVFPRLGTCCLECGFRVENKKSKQPRSRNRTKDDLALGVDFGARIIGDTAMALVPLKGPLSPSAQ